MSEQTFLQKAKKVLGNITTFGATGRIDKAASGFDNIVGIHNERLAVMLDQENIFKNESKSFILEKKTALERIKRISKIINNIRIGDRDFDIAVDVSDGGKLRNISINEAIKEINIFNMAIGSTAAGLSSGASTALGAWALVSTYGAASTGTAISTLSGVAATNATLAWFGGGSLATGGLGMAGGTAIIGGIVAVPALALAAIVSHVMANRKIKEISEASLEIVETIDLIEQNIVFYEVHIKRCNEIITSLTKETETFVVEFKRIYKKLFPIPVISRFIKAIKKHIFRKNYYSQKELELISYMINMAKNAIELIETPLIRNEKYEEAK